jgi:hypothetical protein
MERCGRIMAMASSDSSSGGNGDRDVFGSLPNTRPQRRSARRDRAGAKAKPAVSGQASAGAAAKEKAPARTKPTAEPGAAAQASAGARAKPAARAGAAAPAKAAPPRASTSKSATDATPPRATTSNIPPAGYATPRGDDGVPHGAELVSTAVQAAGELAQIGLAAGGRALKSALGRLPRP